MRALDRKLVRELWRLRGQVIAVAMVVASGVAVLVMSLSTLVAAELIAAQSGVGYMIMSAANFLATDVVFVGLIVIAVFAFVFATGMRFLEHRVAPWKGKL